MRKILLLILGASVVLLLVTVISQREGNRLSSQVEPRLVNEDESKQNKEAADSLGDVKSIKAIGQQPQRESSSWPPPYTGQSIMDLGNDPIINSLPKSVIDRKKINLAALAEKLTKEPDNFEGWIYVGNYKKFFNNYLGARDAWEYAKIIAPDHPLSYLNLANLYAYYLHDLESAERNFLDAIELDALDQYRSRYSTANFYRDFGEKEKALQFYKEALKFNPQDEAIKTEISRLEAQLGKN